MGEVRKITDLILDKQDKIFEELKAIREDFNNQRLICENRITTIEVENKTNAQVRGSIFGILGAITVFFLKWLFDKFIGNI